MSVLPYVLALVVALLPSLARAGDPSPPPSNHKKSGSSGPGFGIYADALAMLTLSPGGSTHTWGDSQCPEIGMDTTCDTKAPIGALLEGRLGLRFGYLGIEGIALAAGDWSKASVDGDFSLPSASFKTDMHVGRVGGGFGGGLRFLSAPGIVRVTAGASGGVLFRHVYSNVSSLDGTSTGYQAPFLKFDANVILLKFLSVGIQAMLEFQKEVVLHPNLGDQVMGGDQIDQELGDIEVFHGTQFFLGPIVGFHFGG